MSKLLQKIGFQGVLDKDTSYENRDVENYVDALNVEALTNDTTSTTSHIPVKGNKYAFDIGSVAVQNKKIRIYTFWGNTSLSGTLYIYDQNGGLMNDPSAYPTAPHKLFIFPMTTGEDAIDQANYLKTSGVAGQGLDGFFGSGNYTISGTITSGNGTTGEGYIDLELTGIPGYDWNLIATRFGVSHPVPLVTDPRLTTVVIKEAYDQSLAGPNNLIAGHDLLGDEYILSTSSNNLPTDIGIVTNVTVVGNKYRLTVADHGLTTGMSITTSEIVYTGTPIQSPNGIFIITVINANTIELNEYYNITTGFTAYTTGGKVTIYNESVGDIGVAQKNIETDQWTYTRLLRTKQWNFRKQYQPDFRTGDRTAKKDSLYWASECDKPRCFYYQRPLGGIFSNSVWGGTTGDLDGAIVYNNPNGHYSYETVADETMLISSQHRSTIAFKEQFQSGGAIKSGNWRYCIRFLSDSLSFTEWSDLTNPIPVYNASTSGPAGSIFGNEANYTTSKINSLTISNINPGLYKYVELAGINYVGDALDGFIIKRVLLDEVSTSIDITHTGTETDMQNLDLGSINLKMLNIDTAANICSIDKRVVLSNITLLQERDLSAFAASIKHSLEKYPIPATVDAVDGSLKYGEYQDPHIVNAKVGYMDNETYRFSCELRDRLTGLWTKSFWVDDITFNCNATTADGRRLSGLPSFDLTSLSMAGYIEGVYSTTIAFQWDNDYIIDGFKIRDLYDAIRFKRAECVPEILACGLSIASVWGTDFVGQTGTSAPSDNILGYIGGTVSTDIGEYPFVSGRSNVNGSSAGNNPTYPGNAWAANRNFISLYSPEILYGGVNISYSSGDYIYNYGNPYTYSTTNNILKTAGEIQANMRCYSGTTIKTQASPPALVPVADCLLMGPGSLHLFSGITFYKVIILVRQSTIINNKTYTRKSLVIRSNSSFNNESIYSDYGGYYTQYYRPLTNKYGNKETTKYVSTGHFSSIAISSPRYQESNVFGGDTFTELFYYNHREPADGSQGISGFGGGIAFYCQTRLNYQMRNKRSSQTLIYPECSKADWLQTSGDLDGDYNSGYTIRNQVKTDIAFDPNIDNNSSLPATIIYSEIKNAGSSQDGWRTFLPLSRHDLDLSDGQITNHIPFNGELLTLQPKKNQRQYFNTRGTLKTSNSDILVGDGSVMSRDGVTITNYGCSHKWSVIIGKSEGGNDTAYWIDSINRKSLRLAADGTATLSDIRGMKSFFANNLTWVKDKDNPVNGRGICGVWYDRKGEAIWTIKAKNELTSTFAFSIGYPEGTVVFYKKGNYLIVKFSSATGLFTLNETVTGGTSGATGTMQSTNDVETLAIGGTITGTFVVGETITGGTSGQSAVILSIEQVSADPFQEIGDAYESLVTAGNFDRQPDICYNFWKKASDGKAANYYSIVYSEAKKGFTCFLTPKPNIYLKWQNTYLTPRPINPVSYVYEERIGTELTWYENSGISQTERGHIEGVVNNVQEGTVWFEALRVLSDIIPLKLLFKTQTEESYLDSNEMRSVEDYFESAIKNNSTFSSSNILSKNNMRTSRLKGRWMKVKMLFEVGVYQRLVNIIVKYSGSSRLINK
ncbi:MAG: hypothetical protein KA998_00060 [Rickettsiaceae bacterium]|nr:hypothetical protein [Rickettsiaceae bacterium]